MSRTEDSLVVCEQCGRAHRWHTLAKHEVARCTQCEAILGRGHCASLDRLLALTVAAAAAYGVAISTSLLTVDLRGVQEHATLPETIADTWRDGQILIAGVACLTALIAPAFFIALRLYVLIPLAAGRRPKAFAFCMRMLRHADEWNMVEVFTIGVLLSLVRLAGLADAAPGPGLYALGALTLLFASIESAGLKQLWWHAG